MEVRTGDRCGQFFFAAARVGVPEPSFNVWIASTVRFSKRSRRPLGQRTSTESIFVAGARAKGAGAPGFVAMTGARRPFSSEEGRAAFQRNRAATPSPLD